MAIKIGDKIRFLNSVGGGIVTKFQGKDQVLVEDEDGFEIPAFIRECVVIEENKMQVHSKNQPKANLQENLTKAQENTSKEKEEITITETPEGERLNIAVAYLPLDPKALQQSAYEAYFINDSNYFLFYNYMSRQGNSWFSRSNGVIEPNTKIFMEEFSKEDLNNLERICVQLIAFKKDKPYSLKNAISVEMRVDTVKFYKLHCFMENDYFDEGALIYPVVKADIPEKQMLVSATELQGYYYFLKGTPQYVIVSNLWQASTPVNQINNICTRMGYGGTGNRCQIYVYGGGFVDGHIVSVVLLGLIPKS